MRAKVLSLRKLTLYVVDKPANQNIIQIFFKSPNNNKDSGVVTSNPLSSNNSNTKIVPPKNTKILDDKSQEVYFLTMKFI